MNKQTHQQKKTNKQTLKKQYVEYLVLVPSTAYEDWNPTASTLTTDLGQ